MLCYNKQLMYFWCRVHQVNTGLVTLVMIIFLKDVCKFLKDRCLVGKITNFSVCHWSYLFIEAPGSCGTFLHTFNRLMNVFRFYHC